MVNDLPLCPQFTMPGSSMRKYLVRKLRSEFGVVVLQRDDDAVAVAAVATNGGNTEDPVHEGRVRGRQFTLAKTGWRRQQSEVLLGSWFCVSVDMTESP